MSYPSGCLSGVVDWGDLSEAARLVWGKTNRDRGLVWLPFFRHFADSADVAGLLWDRWLPVTVRQRIAEPLPGGLVDARVLVRWLAGIHDTGKATPPSPGRWGGGRADSSHRFVTPF
ncbi:HD domain-containing protein [Micromonospora sp. NPDC051925]|uniref:HD domain-containing protein n=1 Tax=Micromonospora sp. NPDC051925 TaxID=3364288 RepID=UPI0037C55828